MITLIRIVLFAIVSLLFACSLSSAALLGRTPFTTVVSPTTVRPRPRVGGSWRQSRRNLRRELYGRNWHGGMACRIDAIPARLHDWY